MSAARILAWAAIVLSAAPWAADARTVTAYIHTSPVKGTVTFEQADNGSQSVSVDISLTNYNNVASYAIHTLPVPDGTAGEGGTGDVCAATASVYNPSACDVANDAACAAGALGARHGPLVEGKKQFVDGDISLFDEDTIMGRAMVFYDDQDTVVACADVGYATEATTLYASFAGDNVAGFVRMRQGTNTSETGIFINIYSPDADAAPMNRSYHVHEAPVTSDCLSTGPHYDPFNVHPPSNTNYSQECRPSAPLKCEVGDLSGKHGKFLQQRQADFVPAFVSDVQLPLTGPWTIFGRSIVFHDESGARIGCANITDAAPTPATTLPPMPVTNMTTPAANMTTPAANMTTPAANMTTPAANMTTPVPITNGTIIANTTVPVTTTTSAATTTTTSAKPGKAGDGALSSSQAAGVGIGVMILIILVLGVVFWKIGRDKHYGGLQSGLLGGGRRTKVNTYDLDDEEDLVFSLNSEA